jgi:hypothetical protein
MTCWFNARNKGDVFDPKQDSRDFLDGVEPEPHVCVSRKFDIEFPACTFCGNHQHRNPERLKTPIGPVFTDDGLDGERRVWKLSPDTEEIRVVLLSLVSGIEEKPSDEYPAGPEFYRDELIIWQLGEFHEDRALEALERIARFNPAATSDEFGRTRELTVRVAREAIAKINQR